MSLVFDDKKYTVETIVQEGYSLVYRAFENIPYCASPKDPELQMLSIFVPECYYSGESINGYDLTSAPIFFPNSVGGYMPGPVQRPGPDFMGFTNATFFALLHGYVVVSPGVRGRGRKDSSGKNVGIAPAHIVDLKAAVRYLKANADAVPGDVNKIISNGTSAGGAISSVLGSTGNHPDYVPYLKEIGALDADDSIFAASCYCPITNLDHADMAYEWEFNGRNDYHRIRFGAPTEEFPMGTMIPVDDTMTDSQKELSELLKVQFPAYLNSLGLMDPSGNALTLSADGNGSFKDYIAANIMASAQEELDRIAAGREGDMVFPEAYERIRHMPGNPGAEPEDVAALTIENGKVTGIDWDAFVDFRTRMKETPAFDNVALGTPENELFGTADIQYRHFTAFGQEHDVAGGSLAEDEQVKMMNPMNYIGDPQAKKAEHFRIRHGAVDRDTSLAISEILALKLQNAGIGVELKHPWGIPHAGDYDLDSLFAWIDSICK